MGEGEVVVMWEEVDALKGEIAVMSSLLLKVVWREDTLSCVMAQRRPRPHSNTQPASTWDQVVVPSGAGGVWSS